MKEKRKLNKYEKQVMHGLYVITGFLIINILGNLFLPIFNPVKLGASTIFTYIIIVIHIYGVVNAWGFGSQSIPVAQILLARFAELCYYYFISSYSINFIMFILVIGLDSILILLEYMDRSKYEYVKEREE